MIFVCLVSCLTQDSVGAMVEYGTSLLMRNVVRVLGFLSNPAFGCFFV